MVQSQYPIPCCISYIHDNESPGANTYSAHFMSFAKLSNTLYLYLATAPQINIVSYFCYNSQISPFPNTIIYFNFYAYLVESISRRNEIDELMKLLFDRLFDWTPFFPLRGVTIGLYRRVMRIDFVYLGYFSRVNLINKYTGCT